MPIRLATPLLSVDVGKMSKVDTRNVENLFGMWTVFSKCAESMEDGRRLENLSWRIWNRETLCCESQPQLTTTPAIAIPTARPRTKDLPELSASVDSITSDTIEECHPMQTAPVDIRIHSSQSTDPIPGASRGKEKHITSERLASMVKSIQDKQELQPLSSSSAEAVPSADITPRPETPTAPLDSSESSSSTVPPSSPESERSLTNTNDSNTSTEVLTCHSVVRGFSLSQISSSHRSHTHLAPSPIPTKTIAHLKTKESKAPGFGFSLCASSGEDDSSLDQADPKSFKNTLGSKKQTSFRDEVDLRNINHQSHTDEDVFESDDEEGPSENAIEDDDEEDEDDEDDDEEDWEDSNSEGGDTAGNDKNLFKRVDSKLISRPSLLTTQLNQPDRATDFANQASKSTPAMQRARTATRSGPSTGTSPEESTPLTMGGSKTASRPIIVTTSNMHTPMLSPRTTRRNMLATELTESLRKHLLWERQQKSTTANAVLRRRHTALDVTTIHEYPGQKTDGNSKDTSYNRYFDRGLGEYHQTGW